MAQAVIPILDVNGGDTIIEAETIINLLSDQSIKDAAMNGAQELLIETQDGNNIQVAVPLAKAGILSGMQFSWTGSLTADIEAGNYQAEGISNSVASPTSIGFSARHATLPRIDLVYADLGIPPSVAAVLIQDGTSNANPQPPALPAGSAPLYYVWIDSADAANPNDFILDAAFIETTGAPKHGIERTNQALRANLPINQKCITYDPAFPKLNGKTIFVDVSGGPETIDLPDPTTVDGYEWIFIDLTGDAVANDIILDATASGAFTINGAATHTINTAYGQSKVIAYNGEFYAS